MNSEEARRILEDKGADEKLREACAAMLLYEEQVGVLNKKINLAGLNEELVDVPPEYKDPTSVGLLNTTRRCVYQRITRRNEQAFDNCVLRRSTIKKPRVSVIIPCWNDEGTIEATIASAQAFGNVEIVVVANAGTDDTLSIVKEMAGARMTVLAFPYNFGQGFARNRGVDCARAQHLFFLDADDLANVSGIKTALDVIEVTRVGAVYGNRDQADDPHGIEGWETPPIITAEVLWKRLCITPGMFVVSKHSFVGHNCWFHEALLYSEDMEWMWHAHDKFAWLHIDCNLSTKKEGDTPHERKIRRTCVAKQLRTIYGNKFGLIRRRRRR